MADETDVEQSIAAICNSALYPGGTDSTSAAGVDVRVARGWPLATEFEKAKAAGYCMLTVATRNGVERNETHYPRDWQILSQVGHTLTATVSATANEITIGGTPQAPCNIHILCALRREFTYAVPAGATLNSIAAGLAAAAVAAGFTSSSATGAVVSVGGTPGIMQARVATSGVVIRELARQAKSFQVSVWAPPHPDADTDADTYRTAICKVVDPALKALDFLSFSDGSVGHIRYERTITMDLDQEDGLYRRDLFYEVEYPTTQSVAAYEIGDILTNVRGGQSPNDVPVDVSHH